MDAVITTLIATHDFIKIGGNAVIQSYGAKGPGGEVDFTHNVFIAANGQYQYISTDEATMFRMGGGKYRFRSAAAGNAGAQISFTESATIETNGTYSGSAASTGSFGNIQLADVSGNASETNFYEEGEYTATITCQSSGTITVNSSYDQLRFTRMGRVVHVTGVIIVGSVSSPAGTHVVINLPFTSANDGGDTADRAGGQYTYYDNSESTHTMFPLFVDENQSGMVVHFNGVASMPNINTITVNDQFRIDLTYTI